MKKISYILVFILFACNSENAGDCFQTAGEIITQEFTVADFSKILVNKDVEMILKEDAVFQVVVETGKNLLNDIDVKVVEDQLILSNNNSCNFVRDYGITKIYVSAPNITEIRTATQYDISSDGILTYPALTLISEDFNFEGAVTIGDFRLAIDNTTFRLVFNNLSNCYVSGATQNLSISYVAGNSRFEGKDLMADNVFVYHRGSNDMLISPQVSLTGKLTGTGDVISFNRPATVEVEELYQGRLIFRD